MAILNSQGTEITLVTQLAGQMCYNVLAYDSGDPADYTDPTSIGNAWLTAFESDWKAIQTADVVWIALKVTTSAPAGIPVYPPAILPLSGNGAVSADVLPPFVTARLNKTIDPATYEPATPVKPFKPGAVRISGVPETYQDNGYLTSAALIALATLATALASFPVGSLTYYMHQVHLTNPPTENYEAVRVTELTPYAILGSQNSRKIGF